ncbi:helix-turn-helix domain-containing protein [Prauserella muralis]|uniref:helix-turn-helix domain-containing protein n=1 Tax=Prauserella muralis TaxID=588067 RepID=UPI001FEB5069|nr:helix-turn-helix transcriptional regulator [Prauserella muralis]
MTTVTTARRPVGELLREWRDRRRISQLDLALAAEVSTRHLSFVETGRARPSREMVLRLGEHLDVPLRERNQLLLAAGYAPVYSQSPFGDPELSTVREAVRRLLRRHEPFPAAVVDRGWNLVDANDCIALLTDGVAPELLAPPVNVLRATLHPDGMAPRIVNLGEWRAHLLGRLRREVAATADPALAALLAELRDYPCASPAPEVEIPGPGDLLVPLRLRHGQGELSFFSTVATFGTPLDVTLAELSIESFYPADDPTAAVLRALTERTGPPS